VGAHRRPAGGVSRGAGADEKTDPVFSSQNGCKMLQ